MKKEITKRLILSLRKKASKPQSIRAEGLEAPRSLAYRGHRKSYKPDVVALYEIKKDLFAIEKKPRKKDIPDLISKWILFSLTARRTGGSFFLVVEKAHTKIFKDIVNEKQISAQFIMV